MGRERTELLGIKNHDQAISAGGVLTEILKLGRTWNLKAKVISLGGLRKKLSCTRNRLQEKLPKHNQRREIPGSMVGAFILEVPKARLGMQNP